MCFSLYGYECSIVCMACPQNSLVFDALPIEANEKMCYSIDKNSCMNVQIYSES
jgi:hypothetical protein